MVGYLSCHIMASRATTIDRDLGKVFIWDWPCFLRKERETWICALWVKETMNGGHAPPEEQEQVFQTMITI